MPGAESVSSSLFMGRPRRALKIAPILHPFGEANPADIFLHYKMVGSVYRKQLGLPWEAVPTEDPIQRFSPM